LRNLGNTFTSGIYINLGREVAATVGVASFVLLVNLFLFDGYTGLDGEVHAGLLKGIISPWVLPLTPFTLSSPSLGLLLVFRTNAAYNRWDEARKNWGSNINRTRDLNRMVNAFYDTTQVTPERRQEDLDRVALATWAFVRSMKRHLSPEWQDEDSFRVELYERLPKAQAQAIIDAKHRPNRALFDLSLAVENCPMHFIRRNQCQGALTQFEDNLGSSERLLTSPVPLFYSRHTARFLSLWLLLLPFALYDPMAGTWNHIGLIPTTALLSLFLFGIDELATQMDEPFTILPMQVFCDKIGNWCREISSWEGGDNDAPVVIYNNKNVDQNTMDYYYTQSGNKQ
jgi:predicted membrane chloride channel (bestrophin family)